MAQQGQQGGGGGGSSDNSLAPAWITALTLLSLYFIWAAAHKYIVAAIFKVNLIEAKIISIFIENNTLNKAIHYMQTVNPEVVDWKQFVDVTGVVGNFFRYPVIVLLCILALVLYQSNIKLKYKKIHNMKSLTTQEQQNWSAIIPVVKEDLVSMDIAKGPWAMALTPKEFASKHKLLRKEDSIDANSPGMEMTAGIRKGDAKRVFTLQLGPYWSGFQHCPAYICALAAVFMARINRDRPAATTIIETINKNYNEGKRDFSIAVPILQKYQNEENVQEIFAKHAYLLTVMASLLQKAREDGVVSVAEFLWLKPLDRRLWYTLNCVGRQTPYAEVAGPFAHWRAEQAMGRRSVMPMIDEAIVALEIAVKEVKLSHKEMQELEL